MAEGYYGRLIVPTSRGSVDLVERERATPMDFASRLHDDAAVDLLVAEQVELAVHLALQNHPGHVCDLIERVRRGDVLVVQWAGGPTGLRPVVPVTPARVRPVPPAPADDVTPTGFLVKWVDEIGVPIDGLDVVLSISGRRQTAKTGGDGLARFVDPGGSSFAFAEAVTVDAVREAVRPRWDAIRKGDLLTEADALLFQLQGRDETFQLVADEQQTISVRPFVSRQRLVGGYFDTSKSFILPHGLQGIRAIVGEYGTWKVAKLLIVGHTDTAGAPAYNDPLSTERAESLKDYLTDNVDGWLKWYGNVPFEKRWGPKEDQLMIGALPDAATRADMESPVAWFQRTRGLTVDGVAGPQTRRQLVTEYMALDGTSLPPSVDPIVHGCGENFPQDPAPDGVSDPDDRRVEVFFFDGLLGVQPPPPGPNSGAGSPEYPEWVKRTRRSNDHIVHAGPQMLALRLHDRSRMPIPHASAIVTMGLQKTPTDADDDGFIYVLLPPVCPTTVRIEWGPPGTRKEFPFSYDAVAECELGDDATRDRNRLHNLGYPLETPLEIAAKQFQIDYAVDTDPSGRPAGLLAGKLPPASRDLLNRIFRDRDCDASTS